VHRLREAFAPHNSNVSPSQLPRLPYTAGMGDQSHLMYNIPAIICDAHRLKLRIEPRLKAWIMRGDPGRAEVCIALHGLNAAQRKHISPCRIDEIRTGAQGPGHIGRGNQLPRSDQTNTAL